MQKPLHNGLVKVGNPQRPCAHPTREVLCDCQMLMQAAQGVAVVTPTASTTALNPQSSEKDGIRRTGMKEFNTFSFATFG